jgi:hypothetical protein
MYDPGVVSTSADAIRNSNMQALQLMMSLLGNKSSSGSSSGSTPSIGMTGGGIAPNGYPGPAQWYPPAGVSGDGYKPVQLPQKESSY